MSVLQEGIMALYLQNISKSSKNYPGELTPGISFLITDNINEPVHLQLLKFARIMVWM
jgi:hypothetical protein